MEERAVNRHRARQGNEVKSRVKVRACSKRFGLTRVEEEDFFLNRNLSWPAWSHSNSGVSLPLYYEALLAPVRGGAFANYKATISMHERHSSFVKMCPHQKFESKHVLVSPEVSY